MGWEYSGDVNLEYGGQFIDLSTWGDGYCSVVRVTDIDSGCGFRGAVMVEHGTIYGMDDPKRVRQALNSVGGISARDWRPTADKASVKHGLRMGIADAMLGWGFCDYDDCRTEIVQLDEDGPMAFDGWKADKRLHGTTLEEYVKAVHLRD
jgi:hypothetical protein